MDELELYEESVEKNRRAKYGQDAHEACIACSDVWTAYLLKVTGPITPKDVYLMKAMDKILRAAGESCDVVTTDHYADARIYIKLAFEAASPTCKGDHNGK